MKLKSLFTAALIISGLLTANKVSAQTWNVTGNAGTNPTNQFLGTTDANDLKIRTNNAVRMTFRSNGKVGIGTSSPTALFQVQKNTLSDVLIKSTAAGAQLSVDRAANGFEAVIKYMQTGVPQWKTGLTVNANGTPDYVIRNEISNSDVLTINGNSNYVNINSGNFTLNGISYLYNTANDLNIHAYAPSNASPFTAGNILLAYPGSFQKSGNVGVGTSDPSRAKFVVQGNVGKTNAIFGQGSSGIALVQNWPGIGFNSYVASNTWKSLGAGYGAQISLDPTSGVMHFASSTNATASDQNVSGTTALVIHPTGAVGINYTAASSTLDVALKPGTSTTASFWGTNTGFASHFCNGANENTYIRGGQTGSNVILADVGTQLVGIGTSNPAYKLDVCGPMRAKEVRVSTGWCDYVFADDYKLPALSDVEAFIKTNKHLPEVTPGAIIESEGLEIGKTSAQMIKKIEELTLYVIDLQKQVDLLKQGSK